jgi:hypothetical protein
MDVGGGRGHKGLERARVKHLVLHRKELGLSLLLYTEMS